MTWFEWMSWGRLQGWYKDWIKYEYTRMNKDRFMLYLPDFLPDPPKEVGTCGKEVFQALRINMGKVHTRDSKWWYTTKAEVERFLKWYKDVTVPGGKNDCNKFANRCSGIIDFWAPGQAQGALDLYDPNHARNFIYVEEGMMQFEPRGSKLNPIEPSNIKFMNVA